MLRTYCKAARIPRDCSIETLGKFFSALVRSFKFIENDDKGNLGMWDIKIQKQDIELLLTISAKRSENRGLQEDISSEVMSQ